MVGRAILAEYCTIKVTYTHTHTHAREISMLQPVQQYYKLQQSKLR